MLNIKLGSSPKDLDFFISIRNEINCLNRIGREVNWHKIKNLSEKLFQENGFDLQTLSYYASAQANVNGLKEIVESIDLLVLSLIPYWNDIWPQEQGQRIVILNWLNSQLSKVIQNTDFSISDLKLLYKLEHSLSLIVDKLNRSYPDSYCNLCTLLYSITEIIAKLEDVTIRKAYDVVDGSHSPGIIIDNAPNSNISENIKEKNSSLLLDENKSISFEAIKPTDKNLQHDLVKNINNDANKDKIIKNKLISKVWLSCANFALGAIIMLVIVWKIGGFSNGGQYSDYIKADFTWNVEKLNIEVDKAMSSPLFAFQQAESLIAISADKLGPDVTDPIKTNWEQKIFVLADSALKNHGNYSKVKQTLDNLQQELLTAESNGKGITISRLKTITHNLEKQLNENISVEELLFDFSKNNNVLLKQQIDQRLMTLLSFYYLSEKHAVININ
ncbi:Uncharacterized protein conserved in bacteria [Pasteurella testudinis DSM 23072]|uniref:Uncharacterized protein conserved in bacteria n=1 Tax=Pasteurella testudinis DSM 23072 TaxID=1122938 RepID=A0A1W1UW46_9PAST|nr:type VI secretion system ImpA family N-terminal domain-containing protein [Pasteurella testudinis]SMB85270.1 Uncharacterized protein conserved in bacteria [Pasteurella testudinis DSM 23072]SUB52152.1 Uncharacterized protein conserved in bacteria [Pasteurella testudinis]